MKKFRVWYTSKTSYYLDVEAKNYLEAQLKAQDADGGDFFQEQGFESVGSWEYEDVEEIKE